MGAETVVKHVIDDPNIVSDMEPRRGQIHRVLHNPLVLAGLFCHLAIAVLVAMAWVRGLDPFAQNLRATMAPPSIEFWAGTDHLGRDVYARMAAGARYSIGVATATILISGAVGTLIGLMTGMFRGRLIRLVNAALDFIMAFPALMIGVLAAAALGNNLTSMVSAIGIALVPRFALVVRSETLSIANRPYIEAARLLGAGNSRLLARHVLPNVAGTVIVLSSLYLPLVIALEASLSFLGLGVPPDVPTWGRIIADGQELFVLAPWVSIGPGVMIVLASLAFNLLGTVSATCSIPAFDAEDRAMVSDRQSGYALGVDVGGTFTDVCLVAADGRFWITKSPTTPKDRSEGFLAGVRDVLDAAGVGFSDIERVMHGTTVATNAILEGDGARCALITTSGFRYVLELGRHDVPRGENIFAWTKPRRPVPPELVFEVPGRLSSDGSELQPLDVSECEDIIKDLRSSKVEAVAVCLLHAYANPEHEREVAEFIEESLPGIAISVSHEVLPVFREYERTMATVLNAYVRPGVSSYLLALESNLKELGLLVPVMYMQSGGGVISGEVAGVRPFKWRSRVPRRVSSELLR
jgi:ABC-type dipeptide/oligopeptide/nickel transport system permease subunit